MNNAVLKSNRIIYIDLLRILSILAVIILHITATLLTSTNDFNTASWWVSNLFNSAARFAVPVFFMISGAMILRSEVKSYKTFFLKRIMPLVVSLVSWSLIYSIFTQYYLQKSTMGAGEFLLSFAYKFILDRNYIHLWFLYAIIAIYLTVPLISRMVKACTEKELRYYLLLWFTVSIAYRFITDSVLRITSESLYVPIMNIPLFMGYLGYFILGYYLFHYEISLKLKNVLFNLGIVSFFLTPVATYFASMYSGVLDEMFYGNYSVTTFFMAAGLFILFKEKDVAISARVNDKVKRLVGSISKASFSIYLIHLLIEIMVSRRTEVEGSLIETTLTLLFNLGAVFVVSYILVKILNLNKIVTNVLFGGKG
ncbi:acyltransferase [Paenibacillus chitinolyticus]|uniref:acyltransferase n=1 Tax=Paenibacillus chitinolyticus TaxID=79263 RepID=UPI002DB8D5E7|nr:acyltransferase family protein [Paenibacillus chitinolyticus]MEC0246393.1 acyltransferase family protein [Paenibacillus chitinolyticus]